MVLAQTSRAIGAVTTLLQSRLGTRSSLNVSVGRPEQNAAERGLNLFLYEIAYDATLKNFPLDEGQKTPIWLILKYLLTAYGDGTDGLTGGDTAAAHNDLGLALRLIYEEDFLRVNNFPDPDIVRALEDNPEALHLTLDEAPPELLTKLMQGSDEKLRLSVAFEVRPVMIAPTEPPSYSLLVGVDYTETPPRPRVDLTQTPPVIESEYVGLDVIPSLGAIISEINPTGFEVRDVVTVRGTDLHLSDLSVQLGTVDLPATMQRSDELRFVVDPSVIDGTNISAGSHPLTIVQTLPGTGKRRASNMIVGNLVPTLETATVVAPPPPTGVSVEIDLTGVLLGSAADDVILAFYQNGRVVKMYDELGNAPNATQTARRFAMPDTDTVPAGEYLLILRVNGQQAPQSPQIVLT